MHSNNFQYAEYTKLQEELQNEKRESHRLKELLDSIMAELRERAPVFESYRQDLETSRQEIDQLSNSLTQALRERTSAMEELSSLKNKVSGLEEDNKLQTQGKKFL
jgi:chromosome segregation ATPase